MAKALNGGMVGDVVEEKNVGEKERMGIVDNQD